MAAQANERNAGKIHYDKAKRGAGPTTSRSPSSQSTSSEKSVFVSMLQQVIRVQEVP